MIEIMEKICLGTKKKLEKYPHILYTDMTQINNNLIHNSPGIVHPKNIQINI